MSFFRSLKLYVQGLQDLLLPRWCICCGNRLNRQERYCCMTCMGSFSYTNTWLHRDTNLENRFSVLLPLGRAASFVEYDDRSKRLLFALKYHSSPEVGVFMGRYMCSMMQTSGFFDDVDCIIPVPLAKKRLRKRGYNQCAYLAQGIRECTGIPLCENAIRRVRNNPTQTRLHREERRENVRNLFQYNPEVDLTNKHVLIMDDVLTTGATMLSCAGTLADIPGIKISILSFAMVKKR